MRLLTCPKCSDKVTDLINVYIGFSRFYLKRECPSCRVKLKMNWNVFIEVTIYGMTYFCLLGYFLELLEKTIEINKVFGFLFFVSAFVVPWLIVNLLGRKLFVLKSRNGVGTR